MVVVTNRPLAARATAVALLAVTLAIAASATVLDVLAAASGRNAPVASGWFATIPGVAMAVTGALVMRARPWHRVAVAMLCFGVAAAGYGFASAWVNAGVTTRGGLPGVYEALVVNQRLDAVLLLAIVVVFSLFPDGRLPRAIVPRALAVAAIVAAIVVLVTELLMPWRVIAEHVGRPDVVIARHFERPWGLELTAAAWAAIAPAVIALAFAAILAVFASLLGRGVGADLELKRQLRWIGWAAGVLVVALILWPFVPYVLGLVAMLAAFVVMCVAIGIAITRRRLGSIDRVLGWTILYALLVAAVVLIDVVLLAVVGALLGETTTAIVSAVLVLLVFAPLREPLLAGIQRLVYGRRGDPYGVVARLADELEHADDADDQLASLADTIARSFGSSFVRVRIEEADGRVLTATHGRGGEPTTVLPLAYRGQRIGELELSTPRRTRLSRRDERLLADVVRQAAAAVRATAAGAALQRSREELVIAREAERERLRRDIHDGLGPALAAIKVRIDAARNVARHDLEEADRILETASRGVTEAVRDIRRIVHDLRPPTLDDLGFAKAIEQACEPVGPDGPDVVLSLSAPDPLPAAVEVAAYRIVAEALRNARRHARAGRVDVRVSAEPGTLVVEIADDGRGLDEASPPGVGLRSMRERTTELGGAFAVGARSTGGTVVRAELPLRSSGAEPGAAHA